MLGRRKTSPAPSDEQVTESMLKLAKAFIDGAAAEGRPVDLKPGAAAALDDFADWLLEGNPEPEETLQNLAVSMGAFLGMLLLVGKAGTWTYSVEAAAPGIRLSSGSICFPIAKVQKRLFVGSEHSIAQFFAAAMSGDLPPQSL